MRFHVVPPTESIDIFEKRIEQIEQKLHKCYRASKWVLWICGLAVVASMVAIGGAYIFKGVVIERESIVLLFIGVLATFVVVTNYLQVVNIKKEFEVKVNDVEKTFDKKILDAEQKTSETEKRLSKTSTQSLRMIYYHLTGFAFKVNSIELILYTVFIWAALKGEEESNGSIENIFDSVILVLSAPNMTINEGTKKNVS